MSECRSNPTGKIPAENTKERFALFLCCLDHGVTISQLGQLGLAVYPERG